MRIVVGIGRRNAREHVLIGFPRHQVPVAQGGFSEGSEAGVPRGIGNNARAAANLNNIKHLRPPFSFCPQLWKTQVVEDTYI
jgi:hypothetical protein